MTIAHPIRTPIPALVAALVALASTACAAPPRVDVDRLAGEDLTGFETFAVAPGLADGSDPAYGPGAHQAAREALVAELRARGLAPVDAAEDAELLVAVSVTGRSRVEGGDIWVTPGHTSVHRHRRGLPTPVGDVPLGSDTHVVHHPGEVTTGPAYEVRTRHVVVDVYEAGTQRLLWRGTSRTPRSRGDLDVDDLRERVRAIAARFP